MCRLYLPTEIYLKNTTAAFRSLAGSNTVTLNYSKYRCRIETNSNYVDVPGVSFSSLIENRCKENTKELNNKRNSDLKS